MDESIKEQAAIWCARVMGAASDPFDESAFENWINESDAHRLAFDRMAETWLMLDGLEVDRASVLTETPIETDRVNVVPIRPWDGQAASSRMNRRHLLAVAAGGAALIIGGYAFYRGQPQQFSTGKERSVVHLNDGSYFNLDGGSLVRVHQNARERTVWLEQGRALFKVEPDPQRPFSVYVGSEVVTALGTAFSVEKVQDQIRVHLHRGKVVVKDANGGSERKQFLIPGDRLIVYDDGRPWQNSHGLGDDDIGWIDGVLNFHDEALAIAVERMNRYSSVQVKLAPGLSAGTVSGVFRAGETREFAAAVSALLRLRVEQSGNIILLTDRPKQPSAK